MTQTSAYMARTNQFIQKTDAFMDMIEMRMQNQEAVLKSLENQVGVPLTSNAKPSQPGVERFHNHPERVNKVNAATIPAKLAPTNKEHASAGEDQEIPPDTEEANPTAATSPQIRLPRTETMEDIRPPPPFPQRLKKHKHDNQFKKFLDILKQVPTKRTDPESFTIPCSIGNHYVGKTLCDLGASINLMPKSVFQKLGIGQAKPTIVMLQLVDRSRICPYHPRKTLP
ncbi:hypothetical protein V6N12_024658 [Hibiscus sabdariffa]|uniref:Uncharacterized protein n=1 Tax=Hibiscus sabdariffa TaxID=183260 RepID=A0ABR2G1E9_9ROSI